MSSSSFNPLQYFEQHFDSTLKDLEKLVKIPSISFEGFDPQKVHDSARCVADLMTEAGLDKIQILNLDFPEALPLVYGEWCHAGPDAPTLILYAHHDVQPVGRQDIWESDPFTPTYREGPGGLRMYARGSADDKAGVLVHLAAIKSFLKTYGKLPVNVKCLIEGEEEAGSTYLPQYLQKVEEQIESFNSTDVLVLTDTANFDCGVPSLTVALRGLVALDVEVQALHKTVHSGMWGGPVPDPVMALSKMLATLTDDQGRIAIESIVQTIPQWTDQDSQEIKNLPYDEADFRKQSGMIDQAQLLKQGPHPVAQLWKFPSLTVNAIQASSREQAGNIICDRAWARITIRVVAGMDPVFVLNELKKHLNTVIPWGLKLNVTSESVGDPWATQPVGLAYDLAQKALSEGYAEDNSQKVSVVMMGCGGSIPFVKPFTDRLEGLPALLIGVEDPYTNAHGENESLLVSDFKKACRSQIKLFEFLGQEKERIKKINNKVKR